MKINGIILSFLKKFVQSLIEGFHHNDIKKFARPGVHFENNLMKLIADSVRRTFSPMAIVRFSEKVGRKEMTGVRDQIFLYPMPIAPCASPSAPCRYF
jgi:hypothetical protein